MFYNQSSVIKVTSWNRDCYPRGLERCDCSFARAGRSRVTSVVVLPSSYYRNMKSDDELHVMAPRWTATDVPLETARPFPRQSIRFMIR